MYSEIYIIVTSILEIVAFLFILAKVRSLLMVIILAGLLAIVCIVNALTGSSIGNWEETKKNYEPELTYQEFISLFNTIPFILKDNCIIYRTENKNQPVSFKTFTDYCKYKSFLKQYNKNKIKAKRIKSQETFKKQIQQDLKGDN